MLYTEQTRKAINLAYKAHHGQCDKAGFPYILHPLYVAEQMSTEDEVCVAILHDVVEDTNYTLGDLVDAGFSPSVVTAVDLLTHRQNEPYDEYIARLKINPIAKKVKWADIIHNSNEQRNSFIEDKKVIERLRKKHLKGIETFLT